MCCPQAVSSWTCWRVSLCLVNWTRWRANSSVANCSLLQNHNLHGWQGTFHIWHVHNSPQGTLYWGLVYADLDSKKAYSVAFIADFCHDTRRNAWSMCMPEQQYRTRVGGFQETQSELPHYVASECWRRKCAPDLFCFKLQCLEMCTCVYLISEEAVSYTGGLNNSL